MDIKEALYTTRAMRRVRPDPVPIDVQARILDAAIRAPTGGNTQNWRFLLVDDPEVDLAGSDPSTAHSIEQLWATIYADRLAAAAGRSRFCREHPDAQGAALCPVVGRPLRTGAAVPVRLRPGRSDRWLHLPGGVERPAGGPRRGGGELTDRGPRGSSTPRRCSTSWVSPATSTG